jgi:hypothetical protein
MSGEYRQVKYDDNDFRTVELKVNKADTEVNCEQAAVIQLLDRIATSLEGINAYLHQRSQ